MIGSSLGRTITAPKLVRGIIASGFSSGETVARMVLRTIRENDHASSSAKASPPGMVIRSLQPGSR
jgi:hypothetical protein